MANCPCIMLVEDDEDIRGVLSELLKFEGYDVKAVSNGREALEELKRITQPCLILLDLMMPVMNGWEFLELKRADVHIASIPTVVLSAVTERLKDEINVTSHLRKPVDLEALLQVCKSYCSPDTLAS